MGTLGRHRELRGRRVAFLGERFHPLQRHTWEHHAPDFAARLRFVGAEVVRLRDEPDLIIVGRDALHDPGLELPDQPQHISFPELLDLLGLRYHHETYAPLRSPAEGWVARMRAAVQVLEDHPDITVHDFAAGDPLDDEAMDALAAASGATLPPDLRALYRQADGLALRWSFTARGAPPRPDAPPMTAGWAAGDRGFCDGLINLLPLATALGPRPPAMDPAAASDEAIELAGIYRPRPLSTLIDGLRPLDAFSAERQAAVYLRPIRSFHRTPTQLGWDGLTRWGCTRVGDLGSYLHILLETWGHVETRLDAYRLPIGERRELLSVSTNGASLDPFTPPRPQAVSAGPAGWRSPGPR